MRECNALEARFDTLVCLHSPSKNGQKSCSATTPFSPKALHLCPSIPPVDSSTASVALGISTEQIFLYYFNFSTKIVTVKPILIQKNDLLYQGVLVLKKKLLRRNHFLINNRDGFTFSDPYIFNS